MWPRCHHTPIFEQESYKKGAWCTAQHSMIQRSIIRLWVRSRRLCATASLLHSRAHIHAASRECVCTMAEETNCCDAQPDEKHVSALYRLQVAIFDARRVHE